MRNINETFEAGRVIKKNCAEKMQNNKNEEQ